jgi:hypothetical protein
VKDEGGAEMECGLGRKGKEIKKTHLRPTGRRLSLDLSSAEETLGEERVGDEETETKTGTESLCQKEGNQHRKKRNDGKETYC